MSALLRKILDVVPGSGFLDEFIEGVGALWEIALISFVCAALLFVLTVVFTKNMGWQKRRVLFVGMFFGMTGPELLWLADRIFKQIFVVSVLCLGIKPGLSHILLFVGIFLVEVLTPPSFGPGRLLFALVNNAVIFCALLVTGMLSGFLRDVRGDGSVLLIYILMALFVILYSLYFTLRDVGGLLERKNRAPSPEFGGGSAGAGENGGRP
ncbi:MAG: hypothetical protein LBP30_04610 [Clostridiales Family XIII bacterium]|jgi:hypothetical protein|nr:hypothetical protein [Clostridiales Family XIII bacterium]